MKWTGSVLIKQRFIEVVGNHDYGLDEINLIQYF